MRHSSIIVLALATNITPSAAKYVYHTEAIFMYASNDTPSISTKAQEFLSLTVKLPYFDTIQN